jgi:hypothetical protein
MAPPPRKHWYDANGALVAFLFTVFLWWQARTDRDSDTMQTVRADIAVLKANLEKPPCPSP